MTDADTSRPASFADAFDQLLTAHGMTQADAARKLGVYSGDVSRWRRGAGGISIKNVRKIAALFDVDRAWLERLAGYGDDSSTRQEPSSVIDAKRQSIRAQLDSWLNAIGPENEPYFWDYLKTHGDTGVDLIRLSRTAISRPSHTTVSDVVSERPKRGRKMRKDSDGPLTAREHTHRGLIGSSSAPRTATKQRLAA